MKRYILLTSCIIYNLIAFSQNTYVPDDNFEQRLIGYGLDDVLDDYVLTENINSITGLSLASSFITDLTGIEDFVSLTNFTCENNQITTLDLSQNTQLSTIRLTFNQINGTVDLSQNVNLYQLECDGNFITDLILPATSTLDRVWCRNNALTTLDTTQNPELRELVAGDNQINSLDVSQNTQLRTLSISSNQLTNIDLSNNVNLFVFTGGGNEFTDLDFSNNPDIVQINCVFNNLTSLNLNNNNNSTINTVQANDNPNLTCIQVDNVDYSLNNWVYYIDAQSYFSEDCSNLSIEEFTNQSIDVFPNPTNNTLYVKLNKKASYSLLDGIGKIRMVGDLFKAENSINLSQLASGIYFLKIKTNNQVEIKKVVKI